MKSSWKTLRKPSLYAVLCKSSNFKPSFDKVKVQSRKIYAGESCRKLNFFLKVVEAAQSKDAKIMIILLKYYKVGFVLNHRWLKDVAHCI